MNSIQRTALKRNSTLDAHVTGNRKRKARPVVLFVEFCQLCVELLGSFVILDCEVAPQINRVLLARNEDFFALSVDDNDNKPALLVKKVGNCIMACGRV